MTSDLFDFEWFRDSAGYELVQEPARQGAAARLLNIKRTGVEVSVRRKGGELKAYPPRAVPALHRQFTRLPDDASAVLNFIESFGFLGLDGGAPQRTESEPLSGIFGARDELKAVHAALDEMSRLERKLQQVARQEYEYGGKPAADVGEVRQLAAGLFNQWAAAHTGLRCILKPTVRRGKSSVELRVIPQTLLGAMWLATAEEIAGGPRQITCEVCGKPIPPGARADKTTCSPACRQKLSRAKRAATAKAPKRKTIKRSAQRNFK